MVKIRRDVGGETRWKKASDSPLMYLSHCGRWGIVRVSMETWELHLLRKGTSVRKMGEFAGSNLPREEVEPVIQAHADKASSAKWREAEVGRVVPGQEGHRARPIPMQTRGRRG